MQNMTGLRKWRYLIVHSHLPQSTGLLSPTHLQYRPQDEKARDKGDQEQDKVLTDNGIPQGIAGMIFHLPSILPCSPNCKSTCVSRSSLRITHSQPVSNQHPSSPEVSRRSLQEAFAYSITTSAPSAMYKPDATNDKMTATASRQLPRSENKPQLTNIPLTASCLRSKHSSEC